MEGKHDIFNHQRRRATIEANLVPLINIVFLLLIFFLVAGNALSPEDQSFQRPTALTGKQIDDDALKIKLTHDFKVEIDDYILTRAEMKYLEDRIHKIVRSNKNRQILLSADSRISSKYLTKMLAIISAAGAQNIAIATTSTANE